MECETFYIRTYTGRKFHLDHPVIGEVDIIDIAHALSLCNRWNGMTELAYSVAQHSVHVARRMMACSYPIDIALAGLLHDASEAYTGDMVSPLKRLCPFFQAIENDIQEVIYRRYGLQQAHLEVKGFDTDAYRLEYRDLMPGDHTDIIPPVGNQPTLVPMLAPRAEKEFLEMFYSLKGPDA